ncbi:MULTISPECIES: DUF2971 domain-containing protein [unclassified Pseudomonas]|uniref:DUF2971 domain-containing protein n=1 Tax=unclassified Pseudomonas TaxID=196821 RepID=UPI0008764476|nr:MULTISPECIES: DUF2971 domain-containing protein [unclassified Pseudomonas]SCZ75154.1 Protein of unknown function [Pseudomonas sp. NFPP17]SDA86910.1 Protein of unknown function [Pseudomonas sp. NFPP15]SEL90072.1 Protein of unknown function [Pseudomonas sp. NFPP18]SFA67614.1 Protein of unknown function [Pseudomonas sp. NFPP13]SFU09859.1 Protein of unknown function [Pseudomonas sp. NFPP25]
MKVPDVLYKYTTASTTQIVLRTGRLRWQSPCQFNDASELQRMPILSPSFDESKSIYSSRLVEIVYSSMDADLSIYSQWTQKIIGLLRQLKKQGVPQETILKKLESIIPKTTESLERLFRKSTELNNNGTLRCFCLTENELSTLMWAHYGDSYKGCMLGFQHIDELSTPFGAAEKVRYTNEAPIIGSAVDFLLYGPSSEQKKETRLAIYHTKAKDWEYEKEWRVIHKVNPGGDTLYTDFKFYPGELKSITFGLRLSPEIKAEILKLISYQYAHCELYQLEMIAGVIRRMEYAC